MSEKKLTHEGSVTKHGKNLNCMVVGPAGTGRSAHPNIVIPSPICAMKQTGYSPKKACNDNKHLRRR